MTAKAYIEHRPTGQSIDLQKTNIDNFTVNKGEFSFAETIEFFVKNPQPFLADIQKDLVAFQKQLQKYSVLLDVKNGECWVPRNLVETIDPANAHFSLFTDVDKFQAFYQETLSISEKWQHIRSWMGEKARKKTITDNLSQHFKEWDKYTYSFDSQSQHNRYGIPKVGESHWFTVATKEYNSRSETRDYSFCAQIEKLGKKYKLEYFYNMFNIGNAVEVGVFNIYDAVFAVMGKNPFSKILSSEVFSYPSSDFCLAQAPSLDIPESLSLYAVALRIPGRIPEDCWLKITGHGRQIFTDYKENLAEATAFTSLEAAIEAAGEVSYRTLEASVVEFESFSRKVHATPKGATDLTATLRSTLEARDIEKQLKALPVIDAPTATVKPRHKI